MNGFFDPLADYNGDGVVDSIEEAMFFAEMEYLLEEDEKDGDPFDTMNMSFYDDEEEDDLL